MLSKRFVISEEVIIMMKSMKKLSVGIGKVGYQITKTNVNSACAVFMHQDKLPDTAKKLRKF